MDQPGEITRLLQEADRGDAAAANRLFVLVEDDLRAIARRRKRSARPGADMSTTVLVDEAFMRLVGGAGPNWISGDRRKFFGYVSNKIHDLLIEAARAEAAAKRGGGHNRVEAEPGELAGPSNTSSGADTLLDLKDALDRFEQFAPEDALLFRVRFFLSCTIDEAAELLGVSDAEVKRGYRRAKLWLRHELRGYDLET